MLFSPLPSTLRRYDGTRLSRSGTRADVALFNESQSRIVITFAPRHASEILDFLKSRSAPQSRPGTVTADQTLKITAANTPCEWPLENLRTAHEGIIPSLMAWEK